MGRSGQRSGKGPSSGPGWGCPTEGAVLQGVLTAPGRGTAQDSGPRPLGLACSCPGAPTEVKRSAPSGDPPTPVLRLISLSKGLRGESWGRGLTSLLMPQGAPDLSVGSLLPVRGYLL